MTGDEKGTREKSRESATERRIVRHGFYEGLEMKILGDF